MQHPFLWRELNLTPYDSQMADAIFEAIMNRFGKHIKQLNINRCIRLDSVLQRIFDWIPQLETFIACGTCLTTNHTSCKSCIAGYTYDSTTFSCIPITECDGPCTVCPLGYSLLEGECI